MNPNKAQRHILVVDDDDFVRIALERCLKSEGYLTTSVCGAPEALDLLATRSFDAVLTDYLMPTMNGLELLKRVRNRYPDALRMMLTGHAETTVAIDAINHGEIYRFLTKPWDVNELKVTLFVAFEQQDLERENRRLLTMVRQQTRLLEQVEAAMPGLLGSISEKPLPVGTV
jgi:DNA-binding NtrC family response regulator